MLEVIFAGKSRVDAVKVAGLGVEEGGGEEEEEAWGVVTQFHLLYKDPKTDKWLYYADSSGKARVSRFGVTLGVTVSTSACLACHQC